MPLDSIDRELLDAIRDVYAVADPPPPHLVERVQFALELEDADIEVFRLGGDRELQMATRGERSRTVTFDSDSMSIMIHVSPAERDRVRIDGWLAPPDARRVELRVSGGSMQTDADDQGRFVFELVRHGLVQIAVQLADDEGPHRRRLVVTPSIEV